MFMPISKHIFKLLPFKLIYIIKIENMFIMFFFLQGMHIKWMRKLTKKLKLLCAAFVFLMS